MSILDNSRRNAEASQKASAFDDMSRQAREKELVTRGVNDYKVGLQEQALSDYMNRQRVPAFGTESLADIALNYRR